MIATPPGVYGLRSYGDVPTFRVDSFYPKYFRQGANLSFNQVLDQKNVLDRVEYWILAMSYWEKIFLNRVIFFIY